MLKIHHAAIDGVSGAEIITAIHSMTKEVEPPLVEDDWQGENAPSPLQAWSRAYINNIRRPVKLLETATELLPALLKERLNALDKGEEDDPPGGQHEVQRQDQRQPGPGRGRDGSRPGESHQERGPGEHCE